ncbi:hypothetical protein SAY86_018282 [Trapa natans]|uniref:Autophagy-related protein n=1 Tax=Trapa natans TaxID=22666 RepID=A0AAN7LGL6_TRANT|nr:hypothetical protein SAY86_018282 [Trapa natans]
MQFLVPYFFVIFQCQRGGRQRLHALGRNTRIEFLYEESYNTDLPCFCSGLLSSNLLTGMMQVIVERAEKSDVPEIDKKKYLVPADLTVGQFVYVVRKRIRLSPEKAIFVFVKNVLPPTAAMMSAIYEENKDEDGFLYMTYSGENTFGSVF